MISVMWAFDQHRDLHYRRGGRGKARYQGVPRAEWINVLVQAGALDPSPACRAPQPWIEDLVLVLVDANALTWRRGGSGVWAPCPTRLEAMQTEWLRCELTSVPKAQAKQQMASWKATLQRRRQERAAKPAHAPACEPALQTKAGGGSLCTPVHPTLCMREVFGDGRLVKQANGFAIEAPGLHTPALLLAGVDGTPLPDLSEHEGKVISYTGLLQSTGDNQECIALHPADIQLPAVDAHVSPMWCLLSGNLGKAPEPNPKGDRLVASLAYDKVGGDASWLRITAYPYFSIAELFAIQEAGTALIAYGALESYDYNGKPRAQLSLRGFQLLARASTAPTPPTSLMSARSADTIAPHAFDDAA